MVDSADIYFIQHFADIYFSKSVCISVCRVYQVSRTYCQVSFINLIIIYLILITRKLSSGFAIRYDSNWPAQLETSHCLEILVIASTIYYPGGEQQQR